MVLTIFLTMNEPRAQVHGSAYLSKESALTEAGNSCNWTDDTQAYIYMDCKGGNPVSALGVGGNGLWNKNNCSPDLDVAFRPCVSGDLH